MISRLTALVTAMALAACGGSATSDGSGGTGAASGSGGTGAASGSGGSGGSGASSGGGGLPSGGAPGGGGGPSGGGAPSGGAPGGGGAPCASLQSAYLDTLQKAKACNPFIDFEECTAKVPTELECPCGDTYVNPGNTEALKNLSDLEYFWNAQNCSVGVACPDIACVEPKAGSCQPNAAAATGSCQDVY